MNVLDLLNEIYDFTWGLMVDWILYVGIFLTLGLQFIPLRHLGFSLRAAWRSTRHSEGEGRISAFAALMNALGGNIGTGSLAGIAFMISVGGPGSLFWMWVATVVSMATKFAEALLAVQFRSHNDKGELVGGPMYYMRNGLPPSLQWLALVFASIGAIGTFGLGNGVQAMELAKTLNVTAGVPNLLTGCVLAAGTLWILQGGICRISRVSCVVVPVMVIGYILATGTLLLQHRDAIPAALQAIWLDAFNAKAVAGGSLLIMVSAGVRRAVFAQEIGMGTTPIVHAVARPQDPVMQGMVAMLGGLITALVGTMTGLIVLCSNSYLANQDGITMLDRAFEWAFSGSGAVIDVATVLFTFTTIIVFAYYGERCLEFVLGSRSNLIFRLIWIAVLVFSSVTSLRSIWLGTEILNALMALPNILALVMLSTNIFRITKDYRFAPR